MRDVSHSTHKVKFFHVFPSLLKKILNDDKQLVDKKSYTVLCITLVETKSHVLATL